MSSSRVKNDVLDFNPKLFSSEIIYLSEEIMGKYRDSVVGALESRGAVISYVISCRVTKALIDNRHARDNGIVDVYPLNEAPAYPSVNNLVWRYGERVVDGQVLPALERGPAVYPVSWVFWMIGEEAARGKGKEKAKEMPKQHMSIKGRHLNKRPMRRLPHEPLPPKPLHPSLDHLVGFLTLSEEPKPQFAVVSRKRDVRDARDAYDTIKEWYAQVRGAGLGDALTDVLRDIKEEGEEESRHDEKKTRQN